MSEEIIIMGLYSEAQLKALFWASYPSGLLSIIGSATIIYLVLRGWKGCGTYNRVMLGLGMYDFLSALGTTVFKSWSVPEESGLAYMARGNVFTCNINAFFVNMLIGSYWYTTFLAIFFALAIRFEVSKHTIAKYWEPIFHLVPTLVTLTSAIFGIVTGLFNPLDELAGFCWMGEYPPICNDYEGVACIRGGKETKESLVSHIFGIGTAFITLVSLIVSMLLIIVRVWSTEHRLKRYGQGASSQWQRTKESGVQALLYIGCFFVSSCAIIVIQLSPQPTTRENADYYFALCMLASILTPLTGALNALVYIRPRYRELTGPNGPLNISILRRSSGLEGRGTTGGAVSGEPQQHHQSFAEEISRVDMAQSQPFADLDSFHATEDNSLHDSQ
jgi:uncharacterized membrane protein